MLYRPYGTTGKDVSLIGVGTVRFSPDKELFSENVDIVMKALERGVNYFDTASTYVSGLSEKILGTAFKQDNRKELFVSTKSMLSRDPTADDVLRRIEAALLTLNVDRIAFFHMWNVLNIEQYRKIIAPGGPYSGALRAKEQGLIDHICFSAHCDGREIVQILDDGLFDGVTLGYNAINYKYRLAGLQKAAEKGVGTAIMNPLSGGLIPRNPGYFKNLQINGQPIAQSAIQFVASHREVSTILVGVNSLRDLTEAIAAIEKRTSLSDSEWRDKAGAGIPFGEQETLCTMCGYCSGCPEGLRIDQIMGVYNNYVLSGGDVSSFNEQKEMFLKKNPIEEVQCQQCGQCESKCTQHLPIIKRIANINTIAKEEKDRLKALISKYFPADGYKKTGVYGLSFAAGDLFSAYMTLYGAIPDDIVFFDTKPAKWGTKVLNSGHKIHPPSSIKESGVERIIITAKKYEKEISEYLKDFINEGTCIEVLSDNE